MSIQFSQLPEDKPEKESPLSLVKDNADSITARQEFSVVSNPQNDSGKNDRLAKMGGAATLDMMNFYGTAPSTGLDSEDDASTSRSNFVQRQPGAVSEWTIGNGVGSLANMTAEERQKKKDEESAEQLSDAFADIEEKRKEREQEEWLSKKSIEVGNGITMSAEEIDTLLSVLGTEAGRKKFADAYKKKTGATDEQSKKAAEDAERYFRLLKQKEMGKDLGQEDADFLKTFPKTEEGKAVIQVAKEEDLTKQSLDFTTTKRAEDINISTAGSSQSKMEKFTAATEGGITTKVTMNADFKAAQVALTPLDAPTPVVPTAEPIKIASTVSMAQNMAEI